MTARTHLASTLSVAIAPLLLLPLPLPIIKLYLAGALLGALAPDCDEPKSYLGSRMRIVSDLLHVLFGHRGITHTVAALFSYAVAFAVVWLLFPGAFETKEYAAFASGFLLGNLLHAMGDMMTKEGGIALFYPISRKRFYLLPAALRFRTNGIMENLLVAPVFSMLLGIEAYALFVH